MQKLIKLPDGFLSRKSIKLIYIFIAISIAALAVTGLLLGSRSMAVHASTTNIGLIVFGDTADYGYNWLGIQGLVRAEAELGVIGTVYTTTDPMEIEPKVQQCALDGNNACIGYGYMLYEPISNTSPIYTSTEFAIVDWTGDFIPTNFREVTLASEEVGYLAGTLAALMSQSNAIGAVCGMEIPPVSVFSDSYRNGAQCANPDVTTVISYTGTFEDPNLGAETAQSMISQGVDVIFGVGGQTGDGAILTATQSDVWAIGVDIDQYYSVFMSGTITGSNYLLTSAMKRLDDAVFYTISDIVAGTFTPGLVTYGLDDDGVGLAPFHEADAAIPSDIRTTLNWVEWAIIAGSIDPLDPESPCLVIHQQYLPFATR